VSLRLGVQGVQGVSGCLLCDLSGSTVCATDPVGAIIMLCIMQSSLAVYQMPDLLLHAIDAMAWWPDAGMGKIWMLVIVHVVSGLHVLVCGSYELPHVRNPHSSQFELRQYEYYLRNIIQSVIPTNSSEEAELFTLWSQHNPYGRGGVAAFNRMSAQSTVPLRLRHEPLWNRTATPIPEENADPGTLTMSVEKDCDYTVELRHSAIHAQANRIPSVVATYLIKQYGCMSNTTITGGASIDALSLIEVYHASKLAQVSSTRCAIEDLFSNEYVAHCEVILDNLHLSRPPVAVCLNTSFTLQFEHFDAFSELKPPMNTIDYVIPGVRSDGREHSEADDRFDLVHWPVDTYNNQVDCVISKHWSQMVSETGKGITESTAQSSSDITALRAHATTYWTESTVHQANRSSVDLKTIRGHHLDRTNTTRHLQPRYREASYLSFDQVSYCNNFTDIVTIGESHMRYYWDFMAKYYFSQKQDVSKFLQRHSTTYSIPDLVFEAHVFADNAANELVGSSMPARIDQFGKLVKAIIIQTGTWDLAHWPPRNFMENPKTGHGALITSLAKIITVRKTALKRNDNGVGVLHIIVLDISPSARAVGEHNSDGWRNNYAIAAANQRLFNSILHFIDSELADGVTRAFNYDRVSESYELEESAMTITLVNSMSVYFSKGWGMGSVCTDHVMCHNQEGYHAIPQGLQTLNILVHAVCSADSMKQGLRLWKTRVQMHRHADPPSLREHADAHIVHINSNSLTWQDWEYFEFDILHNESSNSTKVCETYFAVVRGFRRAVPDLETLERLLSVGGNCGTKFTLRHVTSDMLQWISDGGTLPSIRTGADPLMKAGVEVISC
jgi:hypothetical protein